MRLWRILKRCRFDVPLNMSLCSDVTWLFFKSNVRRLDIPLNVSLCSDIIWLFSKIKSVRSDSSLNVSL